MFLINTRNTFKSLSLSSVGHNLICINCVVNNLGSTIRWTEAPEVSSQQSHSDSFNSYFIRQKCFQFSLVTLFVLINLVESLFVCFTNIHIFIFSSFLCRYIFNYTQHKSLEMKFYALAVVLLATLAIGAFAEDDDSHHPLSDSFIDKINAKATTWKVSVQTIYYI